jgi:hypothetical protein
MVENLAATPNPVTRGEQATIIFTDPAGTTRAWQARLTERPEAGGRLEPSEGSALAPRTSVRITYHTSAPTQATVTIVASDNQTVVMRSVVINVVEPKKPGLLSRLFGKGT